MPIKRGFAQTVTIQGFNALVHDLSVDDSSDSRVTAIDFIIERMQIPGQNLAFNSAWIGNDVQVSHTIGPFQETWDVKITSVEEKRVGNSLYKRVQCRSLENVASSNRFLGSWANIQASELVLGAWQEHGPQSEELKNVSLAGVDSNTQIIEEYVSTFDSLYDLMEKVCLITGWAWKIRNQTLYFFDPLGNLGPALDDNQLLERDTLNFNQSLEGVFNVYRTQAWQYRPITIQNTVKPGQCLTGATFDPEVMKGYEVVKATIREPEWQARELEVSQIEIEEGIVRFNKSKIVSFSDPRTVTIDFEVRALVWVQRENPESILLYGRRDAAPISDDGGLSIPAAIQYLDEMLKYKSYPSYDLKVDVLDGGWQVDQVIDVDLIDPPLTAQLYVTSVARTAEGNDLSVSITLTSPSDIVSGSAVPPSQARRSRSNIDPSHEIAKRLERLERKDAHPSGKLGVNTNFFGIFGGSFKTRDNQGWSDSINAVSAATINVGDNWGLSDTTASGAPTYDSSQGWSSSTQPVIVQELTQNTGWVSNTTITGGFGSDTQDGSGWSSSVTPSLVNDQINGDGSGWSSSTTWAQVLTGNIAVDDDITI